MPKKILFPLLIAIFIIQLAIPTYSVYKNEYILKNGTEYKFKIKFTDPYDPFRGRYVFVGLTQESIPTKDNTFPSGKPVYVTIEKDNNGFCKMTSVFKTKPKEGVYFKATATEYTYKTVGNIGSLAIMVPFSKYYMEEKTAPKAQQIINNNLLEKNLVYATVMIKDGTAVLNKLYIGDKLIEDAINDNNKS